VAKISFRQRIKDGGSGKRVLFTQLHGWPGVYKLEANERALSAKTSAWLDVLKVFLLGEVVLGHAAAIALPEIPQLGGEGRGFAAFVLAFRLITRFGPQSAYLFVFLSGFLVGGPLLAKVLEDEPLSISEFARRRIGKVIPPLWVALTIGAGLDLVGAYWMGAADLYASQKSYDFLQAMTAANFAGDLLCLEPTFFGMFGSNGPLWTLGYIVQFYCFGFMLLLALERSRTALICLVGIWVAAALSRPEWAFLFAIWSLGAFSRSFAHGVLSGWLWLACGVGLYVAANRLPTLESILVCGLSGLFLLHGIRHLRFGVPVALLSFVGPVAQASYEVYIAHYPILFIIFAVAFAAKFHAVDMFVMYVCSSITVVTIASLSIRCVVSQPMRSLIRPPVKA
jgi:peptidoglycan/LPS O-acetylase OafA/YrhL